MIEAIKNRKSVRHYSKREVPLEDMYEVLDAGRVAPSAGNMQDRMFILVTEDKIKEKIAEACDQAFVKTAPVIVVVIVDTKLAKERYNKRGEELYAVCDAAATMENMLIQATDMGIASCWVGAFNDNHLRATLDIPKEFRPVGLVTMGYEEKSFEKQPEKFGLESLVYKEKYGKKQQKEWTTLSEELKGLKKAAKSLNQRIKKKGFLEVFKEEFGFS